MNSIIYSYISLEMYEYRPENLYQRFTCSGVEWYVLRVVSEALRIAAKDWNNRN
jgi:hypothetical protein